MCSLTYKTPAKKLISPLKACNLISYARAMLRISKSCSELYPAKVFKTDEDIKNYHLEIITLES